jgi:hypothetical protein
MEIRSPNMSEQKNPECLAATPAREAALGDPAFRLLKRHAEIFQAYEASAIREGAFDRMQKAIERRLAAVRTTTREGAVASLEVLRRDLETFVLEDATPPQANLYRGLIANALGYLRSLEGHADV